MPGRETQLFTARHDNAVAKLAEGHELDMLLTNEMRASDIISRACCKGSHWGWLNSFHPIFKINSTAADCGTPSRTKGIPTAPARKVANSTKSHRMPQLIIVSFFGEKSGICVKRDPGPRVSTADGN